MSMQEAAAALGLSLAVLRELVAAGVLWRVMVRRDGVRECRIPRSEIARFLARRERARRTQRLCPAESPKRHAPH